MATQLWLTSFVVVLTAAYSADTANVTLRTTAALSNVNQNPKLRHEVVVLRAVKGQEAKLPCGLGKVFLDGPEAYVMWLKNDKDLLYRFPNEETKRRREQWILTGCGDGSCNDDTALVLKNVSEEDGGIYRCRVHYQASPSLDYVINVRIVDSPGVPRIYDGEGYDVKKGFIGPLSVGSDMTLICEVENFYGDPNTLVYWRRNGVVLEGTGAGQYIELHLRNLTRDELDAHYECVAQNADVTPPLTTSVVVKMFLPPLSVEIRLNNNLDFEAGQPRVVDCVVVGCVPPPTITWYLDKTMLRPTVHKELNDGNFTVSSLTLAPSLRDNRNRLTCRAHNTNIPDKEYENIVTINVGFRPVCLSHRVIIGMVNKEAETVTCVVESSPEPIQVSWVFESTKSLYTSAKKVPGHLNRYSSSLTWIPQEDDIGVIYCRATNSFGEQKEACTYVVTAGGPPETPECVLLRSYPSKLIVQCEKRWDGGRRQIIHLEIINEDGKTIHNMTNEGGEFRLPDVDENKNFTAVIYASSVRGRSQPMSINLQSVTFLNVAAVKDDGTTKPPQIQSSFATFLELATASLIIVTLLFFTMIYLLVVRNRRLSMTANPDLTRFNENDGSFHREPDFTQERAPGSTNITVNQLATYSSDSYSPSPVRTCRVVVGCDHGEHQQSYFV